MKHLPRVVIPIMLTITAAAPACAQTYQPTMAGLRQLVADDAAMLPPPYAAKLQKEERDFENGKGAACADGCDPGLMIQTIQGHIFTLDGYVFDNLEWTATEPIDQQVALDNNVSNTSPLQLDRDVPQIVAPLTTEAIAFNQAVTSLTNSYWSQMGGPDQAHLSDDTMDDLSLTYTSNKAPLPGIISITFWRSDNCRCGAHGESSEVDFNWLLSQKRQVTPADLFNPNLDWRLGVSTAAVNAFANVPGYAGDPPRVPADMEDDFADPRSWDVLKSGLQIDTSPYEICPYMCGTPSAIIPWSTLKPYLNPHGLVSQ